MRKRTYIPALAFILRKLCDYLMRYRAQIENALGSGSGPAISAVLAACEALQVFCRAFLSDDAKYPTESAPFG